LVMLTQEQLTSKQKKNMLQISFFHQQTHTDINRRLCLKPIRLKKLLHHRDRTLPSTHFYSNYTQLFGCMKFFDTGLVLGNPITKQKPKMTLFIEFDT
jgi:hypothetical protein